MLLNVYSSHDDFIFHKEDIEFADIRLSKTYSRNIYYVKDKINNTICFVNLGGHISAVIFLLKKYYGLIDYKSDDIKKWQNIIKNNFIIYNSQIDSSEYYAEEIMTGDSVYWSSEIEEN